MKKKYLFITVILLVSISVLLNIYFITDRVFCTKTYNWSGQDMLKWKSASDRIYSKYINGSLSFKNL